MKKILLICSLIAICSASNAQFAFNEVYARPGGTDDEYFEIYNNAKTNIPINTDCYSILTYWNKGGNWGWYVIDLGDYTILPGGYLVLASSTNFIYQGGSATAEFSWTSLPASGSIKKFQYNNGVYDLATITDPKDIIEEVSGGAGFKNLVLIYKESTLIQGLVTGHNTNTFSLAVPNPQSLTVTTNGACTSQTYSFTGLSGNPLVQNASAATGTNNGYTRLYDGNCAPWEKSASGAEHTPGAPNNGTASPYDGTVNTIQGFVNNYGCITQTEATFFYNLNFPTIFSGAAAEGTVFPMTVRIYNDNSVSGGSLSTAPNRVFDPGIDILQSEVTYNSSNVFTNETPKTVIVTDPTKLIDIVVVYTTSSGCYDKVYAYGTSCITLPVDIKSFTAARNGSSVNLNWVTMTEQNCKGFYIERSTDGYNWQQAGFVASQAPAGNSSFDLAYQFTDFNDLKGITQYRLRQVDLDSRIKYSQVRSVRGLDQKAGIIVYPNPSQDGKVNVVFEERNLIRDIAVVDMSGRVVKQMKNITNNNIVIDNLVSGMYTIRVFVPSTGEQTVEKVVVNKK